MRLGKACKGASTLGKNRDNSCRTNKTQHNHTKCVPHKDELHANKAAHQKHLALLCPRTAGYTVAHIQSQHPHLLAINIASQMHAQHVARATPKLRHEKVLRATSYNEQFLLMKRYERSSKQTTKKLCYRSSKSRRVVDPDACS
uniref:Putative secreted protein n=1 Tax=Ixodes ricinus TaxID=34613 RepID=A0A0K8RA90_IXORI